MEMRDLNINAIWDQVKKVLDQLESKANVSDVWKAQQILGKLFNVDNTTSWLEGFARDLEIFQL